MRVGFAIRALALAGALAAPMAGCGSGGVSRAPISGAQQSMEEIASILMSYQKGKKPPPKSLKDLLTLQAAFPTAIQSLKSKDVLLYWGAGYADGPDAASTVLAYQKDVPEKGGEVLMQDGTVKKMTADEFKAARKPEGATTDPGAVPKKK